MIGQGIRRLSDRFSPVLRAFAQLGFGSAGQVLTTDGSTLSWGAAKPLSFTSSEQTITSGGLLTLAHGLGVRPTFFQCEGVCKTAESVFSVGTIVPFIGFMGTESATRHRGFRITADATNVYVRFASFSACLLTFDDSGNMVQLTNANWKFVVRAVVV